MNKEEYDELKQNNSYMKAVDCVAKACSYWGGDHFCRLPGKLQVRNGFCISLKAKVKPPREKT